MAPSSNAGRSFLDWYATHVKLANGGIDYCDIVAFARENAVGCITWNVHSVHNNGEWIMVKLRKAITFQPMYVFAKVGA